MADTSWADAIPELIIIVGVLVRIVQGKAQTKEIKTSQENASISTRLTIEQEETRTRAVLSGLVDEAMAKFVTEQAKHSESLERLIRNEERMIVYLKRVCAAQGIEWKDDVTVVPDHRKKD